MEFKQHISDLRGRSYRPSEIIDQERLEVSNDTETGVSSLGMADSGYIIGRIDEELMRLPTQSHLITSAPTGKGKGTSVIIPNLVDHPGSALVIDIRGDTVRSTAHVRRLMGQRVVILDPFHELGEEYDGQRDTYNPLDAFLENPNKIKGTSTLKSLVKAFMFDPEGNNNSNEKIWELVTVELIENLLSLCLRHWPKEKQNLIEVYKLFVSTKKEHEIIVDEIKGILDNKDLSLSEELELKNLLISLTETRDNNKYTDSAFAQAKTLLKWCINEAFINNIQKSTFSFRDWREKPKTVYVVVPEEFGEECAIWLRLILEAAIFGTPNVKQELGKSSDKLDQQERVLFLLDEFTNFGNLDIITKRNPTVRGRGINLWLFVQSIPHFEHIYGENVFSLIMANSALLQTFGTDEIKELKYLNEIVGEAYFDVESLTYGETDSEGKSIANGRVHTICNSEAISKSIGFSDSITNAKQDNWSRQNTDSRTHARSRSNTKGTGRNKSTTNSKGKGTGTNRNRSSANVDTEGSSKNKNKSKSSASGNSSQRSSTDSDTYTQGRSDGQSFGGGSSEAQAHSTNENETKTKSTQESNSTSTTESETTSFSVNRQVSVKRERHPIETVNSLRYKLSERNQMVKLNGKSAFFIPRAYFHSKYIDSDHYMFPDFVALVNMNNMEHFLQGKSVLRKLDISSDLHELKSLMSEVKKATHREGGDREIIDNYIKILSSHIETVITCFEEISHKLSMQRFSLGETATMIMALLKSYKRLGVDGFYKIEREVVDEMIQLEVLAREPNELQWDKLEAYKELPLAQNNKLDVNYSSYEWMVNVYGDVMAQLYKQFNREQQRLISVLQKQEKSRVFVHTVLNDTLSKTGEVLYDCIDRELKEKQEYMTQRYS